jgi:hypothetical protein
MGVMFESLESLQAAMTEIRPARVQATRAVRRCMVGVPVGLQSAEH